MTLRPKGPGKWQLVLYAGKDRTGRQRQLTRTIYAPNERAARKAAERVAVEMRAEMQGRTVAADTFGAYAAQWLKDKAASGASPTTMRGYQAIVDRMTAKWGAVRLDQLTAPMVRAYYTQLAGGVSQATVDHHHAVLRAILRQAVKDDILPKAVTAAVTRPKATRHSLALPTDDAMLGLIRTTTGPLAVAIRLAAATGLRRGELLGLRWQDVGGGVLHVRRTVIEADGVHVRQTTKGKRDRRVAVDRETLRVLAAHRRGQVEQARQLEHVLERHGDRFVLADMAADPSGETPLSPSWLSQAWITHRGAMRVRLHDLRHWYATKVLESGQVTVRELSEALGHADPAITLRIYAHADPARRKLTAQVMGGVLGGISSDTKIAEGRTASGPTERK